MSEPYVGEVRMFAGNFAPNGWNFCDGSVLSIAQNEVLFTLIGTTYGGDGQTTFAVPDLRGRVPIHMGTGPGLSARLIGERAGSESVTLTGTQMAAHNHLLRASSSSASAGAGGAGGVLAASSVNQYGAGQPQVPLAAQAISAAGGSQPHDNMGPFATINYIIAMFGVFPSQN